MSIRINIDNAFSLYREQICYDIFTDKNLYDFIFNQHYFQKNIKNMDPQQLCISRSAGKVLIAGGYGVLQQNNFGLSLALQSYFYCICTDYDQKSLQTNILVFSPQISQHWQYIYNKQTTDKCIAQINKKQNVFVQNAIIWTLKYFSKQYDQIGKIKLLILFDRNFISNNDIQTQNGSQNLKFPRYKVKYNKTGLGSSACVLVSIVKCLTKLLRPQLYKQDKQKYYRTINVISHVANLSAQKKIGSNFDISTAIYGTHLYKNILPHKISSILHNITRQSMDKLININPQICPLSVSNGQILYAYIIDINKGADTRTMVKSFMTELKKATEQVQKQFYQTSKNIVLQLFQCFKEITNKNCLQKWKEINKKHRMLQQKYSLITGVPIEPKDLSPIIDKFTEINSVLYAICPGSGGYDAIFVLSLQSIQDYLSNIAKQHNVRPVNIALKCQQVISLQQIQDIKVQIQRCINL